MSTADVGAIIAAAGSGQRYGARKQLLELAGRPLLCHSLDAFAALEDLAELVVVGPADDLSGVERVVENWRPPGAAAPSPGGSGRPPVRVVAGGAHRHDSVRRGLAALGAAVARVLVHDAARPLVLPGDIRRLLDAVAAHGAAALGHPVTDSVREESGGRVARSLDRRHVWQVQTPQGARRELLERAYGSLDPAAESATEPTDEIALLRGAGVDVTLVEGSRENVKITLPGDLELAEFLLARRGTT